MAKNCILSDGIDIENCILSGYTIAHRMCMRIEKIQQMKTR